MDGEIVLEEEVIQALLTMDGDKASGPNGFNITFFPIMLGYIVKDDLIHVFHNFHEHELFEKSLNAVFIALIPKKIGQLEIRDFIPISLLLSVQIFLPKVFAIIRGELMC